MSGPSNCLATLSNVSLDHNEAISGGKTPRLRKRTTAPGNCLSIDVKR
jgi:hypothetical protein